MRFAYLFKRGREDRLAAYGSEGPTEFFYGYPQIRDEGHEVSLLEDREFGMDRRPNVMWRALNQLAWRLAGIPLWAVYRLGRRKARERLSSFGAIIVVTNSFGIALALLARFRLIRCRVIFIAMGLIETSTPRRILWVYQNVFRNVTLLSLGRQEVAVLAKMFPGATVDYLPFGVDSQYWRPPEEDGRIDDKDAFVLSIGNDRHRDYETLIRSWKPEYPTLRIVTKREIDRETLSENVVLTHGDWHQQSLTDDEVRALVQKAMFVVLPIRNTIQPSGQSACLQAMACEKAVILSDIDGLWDRDIMQSDHNCVLVQPENSIALSAAIGKLLEDTPNRTAIGQHARITIEQHFNTNRMASYFRALVMPDAAANRRATEMTDCAAGGNQARSP
jgi:glycosyltransferase involved in cell wall biosynthesis